MMMPRKIGNSQQEKKKNNLIVELWKGGCPNCQSSNKPMVSYFENEEQEEIIIACSICGCNIMYLEIKNDFLYCNQKLNPRVKNHQIIPIKN
ncbi:MAG: hypothetical protein GF308_06430 [Candidatus Heimdallarchaeota archaeon]|nr:hypothetical protein [Candidatus Heimdallarchaeota archaeon]